MTEHSIKELKRQMDDAKSRLNQARIDALAAEKRYHDARVAETGFVGKVMQSAKYSILVQDVEFLSGKPWRATGFRIKKDGTAGFAEGAIYLHNEHKVLPYSGTVAAEVSA